MRWEEEVVMVERRKAKGEALDEYFFVSSSTTISLGTDQNHPNPILSLCRIILLILGAGQESREGMELGRRPSSHF